MKKILLTTVIAMSMIACTQRENPLLSGEETPYGVPAFNKIELSDYVPAFDEAIRQNEAEIDAIVNNPEAPTFENTIVALDRAGALLGKVVGAFFNVVDADGNDEMNKIAEEVMPKVTALSDNIMLNDALFARVKAVYEQKDALGLNAEQMRLLTETYKGFVQNGANLSEEAKARVKEINQELALLSLQFGNNVVAETNAYQYFVTDEAELEGLPESAKTAAKEEAVAAGRENAWLFTPKRTSFTPVLQYCKNRELRKELLLAYTTRGNHDNEYDNKEVINKTMKLRIEKAHLFGYNTPADYILADAMAHDGANAAAFLQSVWEPSLKAAKKEAAELQKLLSKDLPGEKLEPWDWWYYTEKLRAEKYALNEEELRPYFELSNVRKGVFGVSSKLFGIEFEQLPTVAPGQEGVEGAIPVYNAEVEAFKVTDKESGALVGILLTDYFPRAGKRAGAWMNNVTPQYIDENGVNHRPVIVNVGNFTKPTSTTPSLLSTDDVETLFHEFGHALHGLLSNCTYQSLAGTNVPRDFVELPSQFMEHYCYEPEVLKTYAFHYETGEVIPDELIEKINKAGTFNEGFVMVELLSASILDMDYHLLSEVQEIDANAFEAESMKKMGMIDEIIVRYRSTFYNHIFTTGYEAGYYSYTWSAVLDSDAFEAFRETGDIFNPEVAARYKTLLQSGNTKDAQQLYLDFRGKEADPQYLLRNKGF